MPGNPINYNGRKIIAIKNLSRVALLTWVINNICTNSCSYCPSNLHDGTNHHYDWDHARRFVEECFEKYGNIQCNLSGGEPTVSPFFKELVNLIYEKGGTTNLTSNLARTKDWWDDIVDKISVISVSYHPEFMQTKEKEDEFIDKILFLTKRTRIAVRVMMLPSHWDQCINFYERVKEVNDSYCIELVRVLPNFGIGTNFCEISYTPEQDSILNNTPPILKFGYLPPEFRHIQLDSRITYEDGYTEPLDFHVSSVLENTQSTDFSGWSCDVGLESIFVHYDGRVQRGNCAEGGWIGSIMETVDWPTDSIICNKTVCHCIADVMLTKKLTPNLYK